jgi:hypothetical protein
MIFWRLNQTLFHEELYRIRIGDKIEANIKDHLRPNLKK